VIQIAAKIYSVLFRLLKGFLQRTAGTLVTLGWEEWHIWVYNKEIHFYFIFFTSQ